MKYINLIFISIIVTSIFNACGPNNRKYYNTSNTFNPSMIEDNKKLYFQYYAENNAAFAEDKNNSLLFEFNALTHKWEKIASRKKNVLEILNDFNTSHVAELYRPFDIKDKENIVEVSKNEYITFNQNSATVKNIDSNKTVFTQTLPLVSSILSDLSLSFNNIDHVEYLPFISKQYEWDKERYIMMVATNKHGDVRDIRYTQYFISLFLDSGTWKSQLVHKTTNESLDDYQSNIGFYEHISLDGKVNLITNSSYRDFYVLNEDKLEIQELFKDIYSQEFLQNITSIYSFFGEEFYNGPHGHYIFDEKGNMHFFYREKKDIQAKNYNYFWYAYFEKENPRVALYEQKILWE